MSKTWIEPEEVEVPSALRDFVGGHDIVAETLVRRGITTVEAARPFMSADAYVPTPASELPDMEKAAARLTKAIDAGERVLVWGDFDVDGQTATSLLVGALREMGADVDYYIPSRFSGGHGVHVDTLGERIDSGARVVLTCDTGVAAHEAVDYAQGRGVDVVVTDHHSLPPTLPDAHAVVNPQRLPEGHPLHTLPGVGVAYKLVEHLKNGVDVEKYLDLVALGIVADVALQTGDTRYLLQRGLDVLRGTARLGLQAIYRRAEIDPDELSEQHIGFMIGPRLNALGRLTDANPAVDLLTSDDAARVEVLANNLEGLNSERKLLSNQVFEGAQAQIQKDPTVLNYAALVLSHPEWHTGVVGIVANRLVEEYNRPVLLLKSDGDMARGSARSVDGCDITAAIAEHADMLLGFGGHTMAAGLSIEVERLPDFKRALSQSVRRMIGGKAITPTLSVDAYVGINDLSPDFVDDVERLAPFGAGNPPLTLATTGLRVTSKRTMGRREEHLQLTIEDENGSRQRVVWWRGDADHLPEGVFDLAYTVRNSNYKGKSEVLVEWLDARPQQAALIDLSELDIKQVFVDRRTVINPLVELEKARVGNDDLVVWGEVVGDDSIAAKNRFEVRHAQALAVWTPPPGRHEWEAVMEVVNPEVVYTFAVDPGMDDFDTFVKRLAGLVKYVLNRRDGLAEVPKLAAATAQREQTVRAGIAWLAARGKVQILDQEGDVLQLAYGGKRNQDELSRTAKLLQALLNDSAAYRSLWRTMPLRSGDD